MSTMSRIWKPFAVAPVFVALVLSSCGGGGTTAGGSKSGSGAVAVRPVRKAPVEVQVVGRRAVEYKIETVGELQADEVIRIPARVQGVVERITFREGTPVSQGSVIAHIDPERYQLAFTRAEAASTQAGAQVKEAEAALDKRRALRAKDAGWVSEEELSNFGARVEESQAALAAAQAALALARKDSRDSAVRAEVAGVINQKLVDTGQFVTPGTPIATLVDTRKLKLLFKVSETESVRLGQAKEVRFRVRSLPGREFRARIFHVGDAADPSTRMVPCLAWVEGSDSSGKDAAIGELRPGYFADVTVVVESRDAIVVPTSATLPGERGFVAWVLTSDDAAEPHRLELGLNTRDGEVEVLSGLAAGDRVVVRGGTALKPGMAISIVANPVPSPASSPEAASAASTPEAVVR